MSKSTTILALIATLAIDLTIGSPQFIFQDGPSRPELPPIPDDLEDGTLIPPPPPSELDFAGIAEKVPGLIATSDDGGSQTANREPNPGKWVYDMDCRNDRPPFGFGRWINVNFEDCPAVFIDEGLKKHKAFCRTSGDLFEEYKGDRMWTYGDNGYGYCASMPFYLCPILKECWS